MELLIAAGFILAIFFILLGALLLSNRSNGPEVHVTRDGHGASHRDHTYGK